MAHPLHHAERGHLAMSRFAPGDVVYIIPKAMSPHLVPIDGIDLLIRDQDPNTTEAYPAVVVDTSATGIFIQIRKLNGITKWIRLK